MSALLHIRDARITRGRAHILNSVSFEAEAGEFIGVIGPNGAGKSTLLRVCSGLEALGSGAALINGAPVGALAPTLRARAVSYLPQTRPLFWSMSVEAIVALGRFAYGAPETLEGKDAKAVERAIAATGIGHLRGRPATELSGGEAARMHLARALAGETPILLADEPTAALDPRHQLTVMRAMRARADDGTLVIAAIHDIALAARFCTRILLIENGRLTATGTPQETLTARNLSEAFSAAAQVNLTEGRIRIEFEA